MSDFDRASTMPQACFEQADSGRGFESKTMPLREPAAATPSRGGPRRFVLPLLIVAALGGAGWFGWGWWTQGRFIVSTDDAYVRADMATIATKISGYVATVSVSNNAPVRAGDLLVTVDDGDYRLAVEAAQRKVGTQDATIARLVQQARAQDAAVAQGQAALEAAQADSVRAANEFVRSTNLNKTGFGTQQKSEQALADRDRTMAAVRNAQAALEGARANLAVVQAQKVEAEHLLAELGTAQGRAQRDLDATRIRAPFDGVVGNRAAQPGQYVQPGTRLLALVPLASVYVEANFKETQLTRLKPGQAVTFSVDSAGSRIFTGTLESFAPASGSVKIPAEVAAQGLLRPGLSALVSVDTRAAVPAAAN
jgi:membrane fusion protein (multidrug efflux system)